ncbi:MAG: (Fe-S)-binding protein [Chloroflexota bacterium]|nr:MAG: (Fe-S)-binding protein [Chloroflexota bacterium]
MKKIITTCPHCFNTLKNEYPQFGGSYEVIHHAAFLADLTAQGKVKVSKSLQRTITIHDPCYLGRYNDIYEQPRQVLHAIPGVKLVEVARSRARAMCCCCGGGPRAFMEDRHGKKIIEAHVEQAMAVSPDVIGTACPYCMTMLEDGMKAKGVDEKMKPIDVVELLAEAIEPAPVSANSVEVRS